jgi:hypothetical protein
MTPDPHGAVPDRIRKNKNKGTEEPSQTEGGTGASLCLTLFLSGLTGVGTRREPT